MSEEGLVHALEHLQKHPLDTNSRLFRVLVLMKAYLPDSYLLISECQDILGPPDLIFGGPPFGERMAPFVALIETTISIQEHKCTIQEIHAERLLLALVKLEISRSEMIESLMNSLGGHDAAQYVSEFIKELLTKREKRRDGRRKKFSRLVANILKHEGLQQALRVCEIASKKYSLRPAFPQLVARLYYINTSLYKSAERWAKTAIARAPRNSFIADTLGQVYKARLKKNRDKVERNANEAVKAFKYVISKAEMEEAPGAEPEGTVGTSGYFNNRGHFGLVEVAKIAFEKLNEAQRNDGFVQRMRGDIEDKFEFFENYLTFSRFDEETLDPHYLWEVVALCYKHYTGRTASESTSFPGLLDCLNHGLLTSRDSRSGRKVSKDLEEIHKVLEANYEEAAERFILSNIILCNRDAKSPRLTSVTKLQSMIRGLLATEERFRSPEFYLLVLLLFWPDQPAPPEPAEGGARVQPAEWPLNLQQHVTFMEEAYQRSTHAKYLRGRYLVPLFFLGRGSGLSKWVHTSRLQDILEKRVKRELEDEEANDQNDPENWIRTKVMDMWADGEAWQVAEVQEVLLPVRVEPLESMMCQEEEEPPMYVCLGDTKIRIPVEVKPKTSEPSPDLCYLAFNIKGPVLFSVSGPPVDTRDDRFIPP